MTATTGPGAVGPATALPSLVDALVGAPLDGLDVGALQAQIAAVTPQVLRVQGWLQLTAGRLEQEACGATVRSPRHRPRSCGTLGEIRLHHLTVPWHPDQQTAGRPPDPLADPFGAGP